MASTDALHDPVDAANCELPAASASHAAHRGSLARTGVALLRGVVPSALIGIALECAEQRYRWIEAVIAAHGHAELQRRLPPAQRYLQTVSSFSLSMLACGDAFDELVDGFAGAEIRRLIEAALDGPVVTLAEQGWVRRQYAPANAPARHTPHAWHQDGALGFDFIGYCGGAFPPAAPRPLATCWFPLVRCGIDAPGLEWVARRLPGLLPVAELHDERVRARYAPKAFRRPALAPGDALVICGDVLHRTHVTAGMHADRTSIELRFVRA